MLSSLELAGNGEVTDAPSLLDDGIAQAKRDHDVRWVRRLCQHAAIVCRHAEELARAQSYYLESLAVDPENPATLYGLAIVTLDRGEADIARQYAKT
jgi:Tfp pilus assembly protein PilF